MNKDIGFVLGFVALLIVLAVGGHGTKNQSASKRATSTPESTISPKASQTETVKTSAPSKTQSAPKARPVRRLTNEEIERKLAGLYRSLDTLDEKVRDLTLRSPASPFAGTVDLRIGNARDTDPRREYLALYAERKNTAGVNVSDWYLESYVTEESAAIPKGDRVITRWRSPVLSNIVLEPGERAYLITGEPPLNASFRENMCTGYLAYEEDFYPSLARSCPSPMDDMERFGNIDLDDDSCYDFVERVSRCVTPDEDAVDDADLSGACMRFINSTLNHNGCIERHRYDPFFDNPGGWLVYFDRDDDLWRREREIIQLKDGNDRIIDYIEY